MTAPCNFSGALNDLIKWCGRNEFERKDEPDEPDEWTWHFINDVGGGAAGRHAVDCFMGLKRSTCYLSSCQTLLLPKANYKRTKITSVFMHIAEDERLDQGPNVACWWNWDLIITTFWSLAQNINHLADNICSCSGDDSDFWCVFVVKL